MSLSLSKCTRLIDFRKDKSCMVTITTYVSLNTAQHGDHQSNCGLKFALVEQFQSQVGCAQNYHLTVAPNGLMRIRACIHIQVTGEKYNQADLLQSPLFILKLFMSFLRNNSSGQSLLV